MSSLMTCSGQWARLGDNHHDILFSLLLEGEGDLSILEDWRRLPPAVHLQHESNLLSLPESTDDFHYFSREHFNLIVVMSS